MCKGLIPAPVGIPEESSGCQINQLRGLRVASTISSTKEQATFTPARSDRQTNWLPPHLVSTDEALSKESRPAVGRALDAELIHPVAKGIGVEIQDFRRTLRPINHSICLLKGG